MQRFKKFIAVFITMVMVMATGVVGFAAQTANLTVKLTNGSSISGTATAYRLMDLEVSTGTGEHKYTVNDEYLDILKNALGIVTSDKAQAKDEVYKKIAAMSNDSQDVRKLAEDLNTAIQAGGTFDNTKVDITITNGSSNATSVPLGYYFILFKGDTGNNVQRALVAVDKDREVTLKTEEIIFVKDSDSYTHEIGEKVNYKITTEVPATQGADGYSFIITDKLSEGLEFVTETAEDANKGKLKITVAIKDGNSEDKFVDVNGDSFELDLSNYIKENSNNNKGKELTLSYSAIVKDNSKLREENNAMLTYGNPVATITDKEPTFTYPLYIRKIDDKKDAQLLAGAEFVLYENEESAKGESDSNIVALKGNNGVYTVDRTQTGSKDTKGITLDTALDGSTYNLKINGLKAEKDYWLVEIKAPDKYNKLENPIKIRIEPTSDNKEVFITIKDGEPGEKDNNIVSIINKQGGLLPETGGMGTIIFTIVGLGLIIAALGMRKTRKEQ